MSLESPVGGAKQASLLTRNLLKEQKKKETATKSPVTPTLPQGFTILSLAYCCIRQLIFGYFYNNLLF